MKSIQTIFPYIKRDIWNLNGGAVTCVFGEGQEVLSEHY
jgi:hypothetical protein